MNVLLFILLIVVIIVVLPLSFAAFYAILAAGQRSSAQAKLTDKLIEAQTIVNDLGRGMRATK